MISKVIYPEPYCLVGNPVIVTFYGNAAEEVIVHVAITDQPVIDLSVVLFGSGSAYTGSINMADLLAPFIPKPSYHNGDIVSPLDNFCVEYTVTVNNYPQYTFVGKAFAGGISNANYARLKSLSMDMFAYRLRNYDRQFLFTTRTNASSVSLRESELHPFVFIHPGKTMSVITLSGRVLITAMQPENTVCLLDVEAIRRTVFLVYKELPSFLVVMVGNLSIFEIAITPATISEERYLLKFKNSLGAFEVIEVTGEATEQTLFSDETTWQQYTAYDFFEERRDRVLSKKGILVHTGYKSKDELSFLLDMIKSDEIYFIDSSGKETRCLVTPDEVQLARMVTQPQSLSLKIRFVYEDQFESPDIVFAYPSRIFQNITAKGSPELYGDGFIYGDDYPLYAE